MKRIIQGYGIAPGETTCFMYGGPAPGQAYVHGGPPPGLIIDFGPSQEALEKLEKDDEEELDEETIIDLRYLLYEFEAALDEYDEVETVIVSVSAVGRFWNALQEATKKAIAKYGA